jgi:hypothetical protein
MKVLLFAGILYLFVIGSVLVLRPQLMFTAKGAWKEFGIGRNPELYTWMPFWLFAILSAILSYMFVLLIAGVGSLPGVDVVNEVVISESAENIPLSRRGRATALVSANASASAPPADGAGEMKSGYYVLDAIETAKKGVPKYIYLGPEPPNLVYNAGVGK